MDRHEDVKEVLAELVDVYRLEQKKINSVKSIKGLAEKVLGQKITNKEAITEL